MNADLSAAARHYAEAYALHYTGHDLLRALRTYEHVIELHPSAPEAGYSLAQIRNIVNLVVPAKELLAAQIALLRHHLAPDEHAVAPAT
jgi:hypothetical protein